MTPVTPCPDGVQTLPEMESARLTPARPDTVEDCADHCPASSAVQSAR